MTTHARAHRPEDTYSPNLHARGDRVAWATCCDDLGRRREMPEAYSKLRAGRAGVQGHRPPAALDARHLEVDPTATPRSTTFACRLTREEHVVAERTCLKRRSSTSGSSCRPSPALSQAWRP